MTPSYVISSSDLASVHPELWLCGAGALILLLDAFIPALRRLWTTPLALVGLIGAAWLNWGLANGPSFGGLIESTAVSRVLATVVLLAATLATLGSESYLRREKILRGEYHALLLWCCCGLLLMLRATELLTIFLGLELLSVCLYALAGYHRRVAVATEAAIKYFLMGAFVSAFVLLGIALLYGETGSTRLEAIGTALAAGRGSGVLETLGLLLLVCGFAFKMSVIPFHAWAPDTYQGAPSPFVAFLSVAPKAASAAVLARVLMLATGSAAAEYLSHRWPALIAGLAVASMIGGNLLALVQRDIKRMLAYSGVAHMGYLLIAFASLDPSAWRPILVYLVAYALMNAGAFVLIGLLYTRPGEQHLISDLSGWGYRYPFLAACLAICMLSLGGLPPTLGFLGKYMVFVHAVSHQQIWLAVVGVLASLVGVFYYLRVVYVLYMKDEVRAPEGLLIDNWGRLAALVAAGGSLLLGLWPSALLSWLS